MRNYLFLVLFAALLGGGGQALAKTPKASIPTEEFTLPNGLRVILHIDRSDPIVAVSVMFHVGSSRELPGKTGFAHLFEHILFQESEHVGQDEFFSRVQSTGGTLNGGTWEDGTIYYEVVPKNALETILWMESDRMGWLLGALTPEAFFNQQNVVMNEKRQSYDNRPYGYLWYVIGKTLYPSDHPYNWQVIGAMEDLANASVEDARKFFQTWYGPSNATLVLAGDLDVKQAKAWVEKYFGEIPARPAIPAVKKVPGRVPAASEAAPAAAAVTEGSTNPAAGKAQASRVFYQDKLVKVPQLTMVWPTVESFHKNEPALAYLAQLLANSKRDVLYRRLVEEKKLTARVDVFPNVGELAGTFVIQARPLPGVSLGQLEKEILAGLAEFDAAEVQATRLAGEKAKYETLFLNQLESVFYKAMVVATMSVFHGGPQAIDEEIQRYRAVTGADVKAALETYILNRPYVCLSVVPAGQPEAAAPESVEFVLPKDDAVRPTAPAAGTPKPDPTPSAFDRSKSPELGAIPTVNPPKPYRHTFKNKMQLIGVESKELPLVRVALSWKGGNSLDVPGKEGLAFLAGQMLKEGTQRLTPSEFQDALDLLGASLEVNVDCDMVELSVSVLESKLPSLLALLGEMVMKPRADAAEFERIKASMLTQIEQREADAGNVANDLFGRLVFGKGHFAAEPALGSKESVSSLTLEDVKGFYGTFLGPDRLVWMVAGNGSAAQVKKALGPVEQWKPLTGMARVPGVAPDGTDAIYVVDFPGAPQSEIRVGSQGPRMPDPLYYPAQVMNFGLGGNFSSVINLILREEKGYTYGTYSRFIGGPEWGVFMAAGGVQTSSTAESIGIILQAINAWTQEVGDQTVEYTRNSLLYGMAREFETLAQQINFIRRIGVYGLKDDYVKERQKTLKELTSAQATELAKKLLDPFKMVVVVVGDAASVVPQLEALKFRPIKLIKDIRNIQ